MKINQLEELSAGLIREAVNENQWHIRPTMLIFSSRKRKSVKRRLLSERGIRRVLLDIRDLRSRNEFDGCIAISEGPLVHKTKDGNRRDYYAVAVACFDDEARKSVTFFRVINHKGQRFVYELSQPDDENQTETPFDSAFVDIEDIMKSGEK